MKYASFFADADSFLLHVDGLMVKLSDPLLEQRYLGFISVSAVTVYELAIKEIFVEFCSKKHTVFGNYSRKTYDRMNGRISLDDIKNANIRKYGERYLKRFNRLIEAAEANSLVSGKGSIKSSYGNIISWRNRFVHTGQPPTTTTFPEVKSSYERGKEVIHCLAQTMVR